MNAGPVTLIEQVMSKIAQLLANVLTGAVRDDSPSIFVPFPGDERPKRRDGANM